MAPSGRLDATVTLLARTTVGSNWPRFGSVTFCRRMTAEPITLKSAKPDSPPTSARVAVIVKRARRTPARLGTVCRASRSGSGRSTTPLLKISAPLASNSWKNPAVARGRQERIAMAEELQLGDGHVHGEHDVRGGRDLEEGPERGAEIVVGDVHRKAAGAIAPGASTTTPGTRVARLTFSRATRSPSRRPYGVKVNEPSGLRMHRAVARLREKRGRQRVAVRVGVVAQHSGRAHTQRLAETDFVRCRPPRPAPGSRPRTPARRSPGPRTGPAGPARARRRSGDRPDRLAGVHWITPLAAIDRHAGRGGGQREGQGVAGVLVDGIDVVEVRLAHGAQWSPDWRG